MTQVNTKKIGMWAGVVFLAIMILIGKGCLYRSSNSHNRSTLKTALPQAKTSEILPITKVWSEVIDISVFGRRQTEFLIVAVGNNVPYIIRYNGGPEKEGGWDEHIPPRRSRPADWRPRANVDGVTASIRLADEARMTSAQVSYTLTPVN